MSLCSERPLVKETWRENWLKCLKCRSWGCEACAPMRRRQLQALAASGEPTRLLTLTVNPAVGTSPEDRYTMLSRAANRLFKRLRRDPRYKSLEYFCVVEATRAGEPHLHILLRSAFVPHGLISAIMAELIDAPIVDIRRIKGVRAVVRYVAKYITKAPARFGHSKRYWSSRGYELEKREKPDDGTPQEVPWRLETGTIYDVLARWARQGFNPRSDGPGRFYGVNTGYLLE